MNQRDAKEALRTVGTILAVVITVIIWIVPSIHFYEEGQSVRSTIAAIWPTVIGLIYLIYTAYRPVILGALSRSWTWVARFWRG